MASGHMQVVTRYNGAIFVNKATRYNRFKVINVNNDAVVRLSVYHSYDVQSSEPVWLTVPGSSAVTQAVDGVAVFTLLLGPESVEEVSSNTAHIRLPQPQAAMTPKEQTSVDPIPILPDILCVAQIVDGPVLTERFSLFGLWDNVIDHVANFLHQTLVFHDGGGYVASDSLFAKLQQLWNGYFAHSVSSCVMPFDRPAFLRIIRMAYQPAYRPLVVPDLLARSLVYKPVTKRSTSIVRIFHSLVDLVGRFPIVRQLYNTGRLALVSSMDHIRFALGKEPLPPVVFFFRLPRSYVPEPALVMEMYDVGEDNQLTRRDPTPYVPLSQLEQADGDPLAAFAKVTDSAHASVLRELTWECMLKPSWVTVGELCLHVPAPIDLSSGTEPAWWQFSTLPKKSCHEEK